MIGCVPRSAVSYKSLSLYHNGENQKQEKWPYGLLLLKGNIGQISQESRHDPLCDKMLLHYTC